MCVKLHLPKFQCAIRQHIGLETLGKIILVLMSKTAYPNNLNRCLLKAILKGGSPPLSCFVLDIYSLTSVLCFYETLDALIPVKDGI